MKSIVMTTMLLVSLPVFAQEAENQPVLVQRVPAPAGPNSELQKKIESDLAALQEETSPLPAERKVSPDEVPPEFRGPQDIPLSPTAEAAVRLSEKWLTDAMTPAPGPDGRVRYTYGDGLATVVCAPLRICTVELQPGERLVAEPHIGDSVRWLITPALYGREPAVTAVIVIKPQEPGLDTSLLIPTDRRIYYLRLVSKPEDYTARVAFAYPNDEATSVRWTDFLARQAEEERNANRNSELSLDAEAMNFNYEIKGDVAIRPVLVFDDGSKTFIRMNPDVKHRELPVLVVIGAGGKGEMLNYRVKNDVLIADRLFDRAQLVLGTGKQSLKVEIRRGK